jgi:hypothetical protein
MVWALSGYGLKDISTRTASAPGRTKKGSTDPRT